MPATAPPIHPGAARRLDLIGQRIRDHRKALKVSATTAAEAAGMSRVTLHRIEQGEASVTMGAYLNALDALGMEMTVLPAGERAQPSQDVPLPKRIVLADYPQLRQLAWHIPGAADLTPEEAFALYERNWRHVDAEQMQAHERALVQALAKALGGGHLLV